MLQRSSRFTTRCSVELSVCAIVVLSLLASIWAQEPSPADLNQAIEQLSSDLFLDREKASQRLLEAGRPAVPLLEKAAMQGELEAAVRALGVLEQLALKSDDPATLDAAVAAVIRLAAADKPTVAGRAEILLAAMEQTRRSQTIAQLERLGAKITSGRGIIGPGFLPVDYALEIGADWRGSDDDLKLLRHLAKRQYAAAPPREGQAPQEELRAVSLSGEQVTDVWLERVAELSSLQSLRLKRTKVTAAGIERLKALKELYVLEVLYSPLDDAGVRPLTEMPQLSVVRLFGTQVSVEAGKKLATDLPNAKVDLRRGGFFGIGVEKHPLGCMITTVQPRSAADRAGLEVGDLILAFADANPHSFEELTGVIARFQPGDEVKVQVYRGEKRETLQVKLGEFE